MSEQAEVELLRREALWRAMVKDPLVAVESWWIKHPESPRLWELYPAQREILSSWGTKKNHLHLKARQIGFSTSVGFFAFWRAYFTPGQTILILSKGEREAASLLDKVTFGLDRLPAWIKERGPKVTSRTQSYLKLDNGSEIMSLPSASDPARSYTASLVIVDEMAFLNNQEDAWASIEPVADIGGQIIGLSTANGVGNMFHQLWEAAERGLGKFVAKFYGWWAVPGRDADWYAEKRETMMPWQLAQEYPSSASEAFIRSGANVFDPDVVTALSTVPGVVGKFREAPAASPFFQRTDGPLRIWGWPQERQSYVLGADTAEGLEHGDFSSAHVVRVSDGAVVATWHGRIDADLYGQQLFALGAYYNWALICAESNNHGLTTITELKKLGYPRLFRSRSVGKIAENMSDAIGLKTTRGTKPHIIDTLNVWLREDAVMPCPDTQRELLAYVREGSGKMHGSPHDDRVMSLAFATVALKYANTPEYVQPEDDSGTMQWFLRVTKPVSTSDSRAIRPLSRR